MQTIEIAAISYHLPELSVTNADLMDEKPDWDMGKLEGKTGVDARRISAADETAFDLGLKACLKLFEDNDIDPQAIDTIIFCTQSPDYVMPFNASLLHGELGLHADVRAFDVTLACSGFTYCLDIARGLAASGSAKTILIVTADTYSKLIHPGDRSVRTLFGDGAAATLVRATPAENGGVMDTACGTYGQAYKRFMVEAGGFRKPKTAETCLESTDQNGNVRSPEHIRMDGIGVLSFFSSRVPGDILKLLAKHDIQVADVKTYVFHQASEMAISALQKALKLDDCQVVRAFSDTGNLVSASIPVALARAIDSGQVVRGDLVMLSGFGVGLSWANVLMRF